MALIMLVEYKQKEEVKEVFPAAHKCFYSSPSTAYITPSALKHLRNWQCNYEMAITEVGLSVIYGTLGTKIMNIQHYSLSLLTMHSRLPLDSPNTHQLVI